MPRRKKRDPAIEAHLEWLGFVRPTGLVVSAPALVRAGAILNTHDRAGQERLRGCVLERRSPPDVSHVLPDFREFAREVLDWSFSPKGYAGVEERPIPDDLQIHLPEFNETLRPDFAVRERDADEDTPAWQLLVRVLDAEADLDSQERVAGSTLDAPPHGRMERLLRQTEVPAGLLFNGHVLRLISAPRGESSGWLDFRVDEMVETAGRPIAAAMRLLLRERRLLSLPKGERLAALLQDSRKFQNEVSERLAEQVLHALYELLRGMQAAHDRSKGTLLSEVLREDPDKVYRALLTVLLRIVFLLYAEERDMLPADETYQRFYSIAGLHERLREDAAQYPDTLDQRYGAWAQLLSLFRMVHDGAELGTTTIPRRHGVLFDPDRFPFLEGRSGSVSRQVGGRLEPPLVPDGVVYRALENLLILDGERISYRALDVEQIGSVYETMMGFRLETATGRSLAIRPKARGGAPATVDLDALLEEKPGKRRKWLQDHADRKVPASVNRDLKAAQSLTDLQAALHKVTDRAATPDLVPPGAMILQPSEERRKSGSHYTPRSLTEPIVRKTLEPLLNRLAEEAGGTPTSKQILDLKVCDPAMGSGAFLVETCRQLGDALLKAWKAGEGVPSLPADEDEVIYARRRVAQRCIYGVDRNPVAVDLAKVSLWLVTLARDHAFTFLDHALRHGDSLVGLSRDQIEHFHWDNDAVVKQAGFEALSVQEHMKRVRKLRHQIRTAAEDVADWELRDLWDRVDHELDQLRLFGDLVIAAFFEGSKNRERKEARDRYVDHVVAGTARRHRDRLRSWRQADPPLVPFHWDLEFPEVFDREDGGFDGFVGNPPFAGKNVISRSQLDAMSDWLKALHSPAHGNSDLVAHFFRRAFRLVRSTGTIGLVATNTIAQGDTRRTGLLPILSRGGTIFAAVRRLRWPGRAAVVVSVIWLSKKPLSRDPLLNGSPVERINAFLVEGTHDNDPRPLLEMAELSAQGPIFPRHQQISASERTLPLSILDEVDSQQPELRRYIRPYLTGGDFLNDPRFTPTRWVVDLDGLERDEAEEKAGLLFEHVKAVFEQSGGGQGTSATSRRRAETFWLPYSPARAAREMIDDLQRFLTHPFNATYTSFGFIPQGTIVGGPHNVIGISRFGGFAVLQSRIHELWALFFGSSFKDDLRYTPTDVFETFPFPPGWVNRDDLDEVGRACYEYRASVMVRNKQGLTDTYNRFHDPNEHDPEIARLREFHNEMDRAVLNAYGWDDIPTHCEFLLDYEIDEENWNPRKKKPWRYRWPDEVHDEVLGRLLELNEQRAEAEGLGVVEGAPDQDRPAAESVSVRDSSDNLEIFSE